MRHLPYPLLGLFLALSSTGAALAGEQYYPLDKGSAPYAVAPSAQGAVWYGADGGHSLGRLDPTSGESVQVPLGEGARPRAIVSDESGNAWVLDSGLNAILRIGGERLGSERFPLPAKAAPAGLESAVFDDDGRLWFTGSRGFHGRLDPARRLVEVWPSPQGKAANGIWVTPDGEVWYAQDDALVHVDPLDGSAEQLPAPEGTKALRGIGADSIGRLWASDSGGARLYRYDPSDASWQSWPLPDSQARPDSLRVDAMDRVWLHDAASGALLRFDSEQATFRVLPSDRPAPGNALLGGRPGETWSAEPAADRLRVVRD
ncbi:TPA: lyase [Pseudomonas aeruginosa]|uniref:Vgb family protein n=1 Tax=Pseudomonas aeruginosa TaxID=287 RepID=UPI000B48F892|nr:lyase [Pseudomonas aeruginosa]EKV0208872.1 lyase [Pseudomonas aeruginosa]EKV0392344.1 lyase [Pseudomonas aeruginosa]EKV3007224.1 lyase [Pseudomonas aeruginosa]EKW6549166.1 lyase [Pseudomonas aeruginosa]EKX5065736.1 lyase [Pseudomonas aeruginosa]